jgi:uncharacterized protein
MRLVSLNTALGLLLLVSSCAEVKKAEETAMYPIQGVPFNEVKVSDGFWSPKIETNRVVTIPASFEKCEENGRMDNFLIAGGKMEGPVKGKMPFDDTDVYKIIEGAAYSLTTTPDPVLDAYVDSIISLIAIGQEEDGYLTTYKTIDTTYAPARWCPPGGRWKNLKCSHELYNSGHMFEAAAAHYRATGKRNFLDIATKNADLLVSVFGPGKNEEVPGHQIVETGLIKLYQITNKKEYLDLARHFLDFRGDSTKREIWGPYNQDHKPVIHQDEAVGHAVRAAYMYAAMTDIAALYDDTAYKNAINNIWDNIAFKKLYITGGIGARHKGESFGDNYELPNLTAYNETCAAIANVYWNYRMFLLYGDSKYMDMLERSLYNGVISGVGIDGKSFFYPNPLSCDLEFMFNSHETLDRQPWFDCSCCPTNMCRFIPSVPGYIYALADGKLYVNLFVQSETSVKPDGKTEIAIRQETQYPWDGKVTLNVTARGGSAFDLYLRIPGWTGAQPVASDLYSYLDMPSGKIEIKVNGSPVPYTIDKGYAIVSRKWGASDILEYNLPMNVRKVVTNEKVTENIGRVALERGPLVYCLEGADHEGHALDLSIPQDAVLEPQFEKDLLGGVVTLQGEGSLSEKPYPVRAIPYFAWNNRGINQMNVWLPVN